MKPILFPAGQTTFTTNGLGRLSDAVSCTVTEERNGQYELHMEYPLDGTLIEEITYNRIIYATPADNKNPQPFRIYRISKPLMGVVEVDAEHISYQMSHIPVMPFTAIGLTNALAALNTNSAETNPFTFTKTEGFGTVLGNTFTVSEPDTLRALLFGQSGSFIDIYGGEWEFDGFTATLCKNRGSDKGVTIRYGKNLTDLKQEENIQNTYTGICPFWKGQENDTDTVVYLPEMVVHSASASNFPYQRTKIVDFSSDFQSAPTAAQLRARAEEYIEDNDVGTPAVSLDVSFIALHQTQEYEDMTIREHINLCDTVSVVFPALNVSTKAKVVKTVYNVLLDRYDSITIGAVQGRLSATLQRSQEQAVEKAVAISSSSASADYATKAEYRALSGAVGGNQSAIINLQDYRKAIDGTSGGYVAITMDANKQSNELFILIDSPVLASAQKVYRWNESGLCYSSTGIDGTWATIINANGKIDPAFLLGTIADAAGKNSWNLTSGAMAISSDATFGGKTLATILSELETAVGADISTAISGYNTGLTQSAIISKLQAGTNGTDSGFYLGADGLLHMLSERVIADGANIPAAYIPTTIVDGAVTSYTQVRVSNGIIYPPLQQEQSGGDGEEPNNEVEEPDNNNEEEPPNGNE